MDEDQLEAYVSLNYFIVAEKIKNEIKEFDINPCDTEQISSFEEMISIWVETVFLALNGVF